MYPFSHNNKAADYSIDPSLNRWINKPVNQLSNQSIDQSINQSINQVTDPASTVQTNKSNEHIKLVRRPQQWTGQHSNQN